MSVLVFGLSGVGKSWLCARIASLEGYCHVSGSTLLRMAMNKAGSSSTSEQLRNGQVLENQALLIAGFNALRTTESRPIIFDGHNIVDQDDRLLEIPLSVVEQLNPVGIVFVSASPALIRERRAADIARVRPDRSKDQLDLHQRRGIRLAAEYARLLGVPFHQIDSAQEPLFQTVVGELFHTKSRPPDAGPVSSA